MAKTILMVESSPSLISLYQSQLTEAGFRVHVENTLSTGLAYAEEQQPNLIICSLQLFDGTGIQLCELIKRNPKTVLIPFIILSSDDSQANLDRCFASGASDVIKKSGSLNFVIERVKSAIFHHSTLPFEARYEDRSFNLLIAEDSESQMLLYREYLTPLGYTLTECASGEEAWKKMLKDGENIDLVITDLRMPGISGYELCHLIRADSNFDQTPIIVITATADKEALIKLLQRGVTDYLCKPFHCEEFISRIRVHLRNRVLFKEQRALHNELQTLNRNLELQVRKRTQELQEANISAIFKLAVACDYKDKNTSFHIKRVSHYVKELALAAGLSEDSAREISYSSMMHDVGKIAIPDQILNKPTLLDSNEWQIMKSHTTKGAEILGDKPFFKTARDIALFHHEKYDGTGYPAGLQGEQIPLAARIIAIVDIFDALTTRRCYKDAWNTDSAIEELQAIAGSHLDPKLTHLFIELIQSGKMDPIRAKYPGDAEVEAINAMGEA